jgi:transcriptional regulator with XRE-family HTH domain
MVDRDPRVTGARIARRRHQLGWTQVELAARIGVSPSSVADWERGVSYPKKKLGKVEQVLGILLDDDPPPPQLPTAAEMERLREHIREVLGGDRAAVVEDAIDRAIDGRPRARSRADAEGDRSERRPAS